MHISPSLWFLVRVAVVVTVLASVVPESAHAQRPQPDLATLEIEQLLEVDLVSTASKFTQQATQAPASVTVVTADEIRRFGYRTLADILNSVRGFYTTYDRNYAYVGVRGFSRPGDYNTRVLLLVDGHRLNEPIYDMAPIGTDFPIDVSLIDRVEVIRGPGSSLYGTSAFLAVVNVLTKSGEAAPGTRVDLSLGSQESGRATASTGHVFDSGNELLIAASGYRSRGNDHFYSPEFDVPGVSDGVFANGDSDRSASLLASASIGRLKVSGAFVDRAKRIPTASFASVFGDSRARTIDKRGYADVAYKGPFGNAWSGVARAGVDMYEYAGTYPFESELDGTLIQNDGAQSVQTSGELTIDRRVKQHRVTLGGELRQSLYNRQFTADVNGTKVDERHPSRTLGVYAQDELTIRRWLLINAGVRLDYNGAFGSSVSPRAGLVVLPNDSSALKVLYGRAFRAPNSYELHYYETMRQEGFTLEPETITTSEVVWEQKIGTYVRAAFSAFHYDAEHLVEQRALSSYDPETGYGLYFANAGRTTANGADVDVQAYWGSGFVATLGYGYVRANDWMTKEPLSNSPRHLTTLRLAVPIGPLASSLAFEARGVSERRALDGRPVSGFVVGNVMATRSITRKLDLELGVYNVLDASYGDPGAEEHVQRSITQDGRTARVRLIARF